MHEFDSGKSAAESHSCNITPQPRQQRRASEKTAHPSSSWRQGVSGGGNATLRPPNNRAQGWKTWMNIRESKSDTTKQNDEEIEEGEIVENTYCDLTAYPTFTSSRQDDGDNCDIDVFKKYFGREKRRVTARDLAGMLNKLHRINWRSGRILHRVPFGEDVGQSSTGTGHGRTRDDIQRHNRPNSLRLRTTNVHFHMQGRPPNKTDRNPVRLPRGHARKHPS